MQPTDADLDRVASELRTIVCASQWDKVLTIGRLIFLTFFRSDERTWHERRRNKDHSIRKLAERPDCPFGKSALTEAVGVYVFCSKYPRVREAPRVTPTHVGKALGLEPERALELLGAAEKEGWSVKTLSVEATRVRKEMGERRGRPASRSDRRAEMWGKRAINALDRMQAELATASKDARNARKDLRLLCAIVRQRIAAVETLLHPEMPERRGPIARIADGSYRRPDRERTLDVVAAEIRSAR